MLTWNTSPWSFVTGKKVDIRSRKLEKSLREVLSPPCREAILNHNDTIRQYKNMDTDDILFHFDNYQPYNPGTDGLFSIRATELSNATLLGFRSSHYLVNAAALYEIIDAYCKILAGQAISDLIWPPDTRPGQPLSELVRVADDKEQKLHLSTNHFVSCEHFYRVGFWASLPLVFTMSLTTLLPWLFQHYTIEERFIYLPSSMIEKWRADAHFDLGPSPRISKLDVVTAWFLKVLS